MNKDIIDSLRKVKQNLLKQKEVIDTDIKSVDRLILQYQGQMSLDINTVTEDDDPSTKTLRSYVVEVLSDVYPKSLRAKRIRIEVLRRGYKSEAKSFEGAMFAMLSNLVKTGLIAKTGVGLYRSLDPNTAGKRS